MKYSFPLFCLTLFLLIFSACGSTEIGYSKDVNPETIYMQYVISGDEDSVGCFLQYRFAGEDGTTLVLSPPAKVAIDGIVVKVDSSFGAVYETKFDANNFNGEHSIIYTDINGKAHEEKFNYTRVRCVTPIPPVSDKEGMIFTFSGANSNENITVEMSDTASNTEDISLTTKPHKNQIRIPAVQLKKLSDGPCFIKMYKEIKLPLQHATQEGGELKIYQLIRQTEIQLKDSLYL